MRRPTGRRALARPPVHMQVWPDETSVAPERRRSQPTHCRPGADPEQWGAGAANGKRMSGGQAPVSGMRAGEWHMSSVGAASVTGAGWGNSRERSGYEEKHSIAPTKCCCRDCKAVSIEERRQARNAPHPLSRTAWL